jgi:hypothetical protein
MLRTAEGHANLIATLAIVPYRNYPRLRMITPENTLTYRTVLRSSRLETIVVRSTWA